jgi:hypothetical protein
MVPAQYTREHLPHHHHPPTPSTPLQPPVLPDEQGGRSGLQHARHDEHAAGCVRQGHWLPDDLHLPGLARDERRGEGSVGVRGA